MATTSEAPPPPERLELVVVGAHMTGMFMNNQLTDLGATLVGPASTAAVYRMFSLGKRPALVRQCADPDPDKFRSFEVEVWSVPLNHVGNFLRDGVRAPLALGDVLLSDGRLVKGFVGEAYAVADAPDVSEHGGWRHFQAAEGN